MLAEGRITKEEYDPLLSAQKWDNQEDAIREGKIGFFGACRILSNAIICKE